MRSRSSVNRDQTTTGFGASSRISAKAAIFAPLPFGAAQPEVICCRRSICASTFGASSSRDLSTTRQSFFICS